MPDPLATTPTNDVIAQAPTLPTSGRANLETKGTATPHRFRVDALHAKGGLGEVFRATDVELKRGVALKRVQERFHGDQACLDRFLREAEITATLEHPGIVPVYGLVKDDQGQPCYAMRFVAGQSLAEAIAGFHENQPDFAALAFRQLLQRFVSVCQTMAYAHSKQVIHRDLKPSNVLLGPYGETLVVDWGLAKRLLSFDGQVLSEDTAAADAALIIQDSGLTSAGQVLGTPAYMPPEQAKGLLELLGPAADVYALGAMLYELLAGKPPYHGLDGREVLSRLRRDQPPTPVRLVQPKARAALAAICTMAMSGPATGRYPSPQALADDVEHWLADEPVSCYGEPWPVRARVWARKHPRIVTALAATVLVGIAGLATGLLFVNAEKNRTELARQGEERQRLAAENSEKEARDSEAETAAVLGFVEKRVFAAARPKGEGGGLGHDVRLRAAIEAALPFVDKSFPTQPLVEARLRMTIGQSFSNLSEEKIAAEQFRAARALYVRHLGSDHRSTLASMANLAISYENSGRMEEALLLAGETLQRMKAKLGPDHADTIKCMGILATAYNAVGRADEAIQLENEVLRITKAKVGPVHPDVIKCMNNLAVSYATVGRTEEAVLLLEETRQLMNANLGADHPDTLRCMSNLAAAYHEVGRTEEALRLHEKTLHLRKAVLGPDHLETFASMSNLAGTYYALGKHDKALGLTEETLALQKAKLGLDHPDTITSMFNLGLSRMHAKNFEGAEEVFLACQAAVARGRLGIGRHTRESVIPQLIKLYDDWGKPAEAEKWRARAGAEEMRGGLEHQHAWPLLWGWPRF